MNPLLDQLDNCTWDRHIYLFLVPTVISSFLNYSILTLLYWNALRISMTLKNAVTYGLAGTALSLLIAPKAVPIFAAVGTIMGSLVDEDKNYYGSSI